MLLKVDLEKALADVLAKKEGLDQCFSNPLFLELFSLSGEFRAMVDQHLTENQNRIKSLLTMAKG